MGNVIYGSSKKVYPSGSGTFADPYDIQSAFRAPSAGDEVRLLNDGTYQPTAGVLWDTAFGAYDNPIAVRGRNAADTAYEQVTISGASMPASTSVLTFTAIVNTYVRWHDLHFTQGTLHGVGTTSSMGKIQSWHDCRFSNCTQHGASLNEFQSWIRCEFDNNTFNGLSTGSNQYIYACDAHHNSWSGFSLNGGNTVRLYRCRAYRNSKTGIYRLGWYGSAIGCTTANNAENGIYVGEPIQMLVGNIMANNGGYGLLGDVASEPAHTSIVEGNLYWNNTSGAASSWIGDNPIQADPLFVDAANDDYRLQAQSPAIGIGVTIPGTPEMVTYPNVGAWQHKADMPGTCTGVTNLQAVDYGDDFQWVDGTEAASYTPPGGNSVSVTVKRDSLRRSDIQGSVHGVSTGDVPFVVWGIGGDAEVNATLTVGSTTYNVIEVAFRRGDLVQHRLICREQVS